MTTFAYVQRWFVTGQHLAAQIGVAPNDIQGLIVAGAMPGAIYALDDGQWWSALGATGEPAKDSDLWYAPAAAWWGRRAILHMAQGVSLTEAVARNRAHFVQGFIDAVSAEPLAVLAFPKAFVDGAIDRDGAERCAEAEWASWIGGGYAVCLRRFSGESCVRKESLARRIRLHRDAVPDYHLEPNPLFDLVERLESLTLPFAPWERNVGTPGWAIDASLTALGLGAEFPYGRSPGLPGPRSRR